MFGRRFAVFALLIPGCLYSGLLFGQQTRAEEIAFKRAEKAKQLQPYVPGKAESIITRVTSPRRGFYPYFGSAYSGGGIALGPGYFKPFSDNAFFDIHGAWSVENYRLVGASAKLPDMAHGKLRTDLKTRFVYAGHLSFFGVGNETEKDEETNFKYQPFTVGFVETFRPGRFVFVGGGLEYMRIDTGPGDSDSVPSTEEEFTPENAPGLGTDPDYVNTSLFCAFDWRQSPGYTTSGGYYRFDFTDYNEQGGEDLFSFRRYDVELDQYVPIFRANQILAFRALTSFTEVEDGAQVPFFLMPKLGGSKELRGFRGHRFRDRYRLLLTAEYRWTPSKLMDLAFFYEWGKMASDADDLNLQDLHESIGIGARFHAPNATILRIELAHSSEYTRLIFDTGLVF